MIHSRTEKRELLRKKLWLILHYGHGPTGHAYTFVSILVILLSLAILPLEFMASFQRFARALLTMEIIVTAIFTIDYLLRIFAAPKRLRYVFSFFGIVDLLSVLPFFLGLFGTQYLRALRIARFLRLGEVEAAATEDEHCTMEEHVGLAQGESVEYVVSRHPIFLLVSAIVPLFAMSFSLMIFFSFHGDPIALTISIVLAFFALVFLWKAWLDYSYDVIYVTTDRLIWQNQHILGRSVNQVHFSAITNVKPSYPHILSYLLGYGSITIETPAERSGNITLHTVRKHEKAANVIMQKSVQSRRGEPFGRASSGM